MNSLFQNNVAFYFDLDGTLIHNAVALQQAYAAAGVNYDGSMWGNTWHGRVTEEQHDAKNRAYPAMLAKYARPGKALRMYQSLRAARLPVGILTAASRNGALASLEFLGLHGPWNENELVVSASVQNKKDFLRHVGKDYSHVFFIDADEDIGRAVVEDVPHTTFLLPWSK